MTPAVTIRSCQLNSQTTDQLRQHHTGDEVLEGVHLGGAPGLVVLEHGAAGEGHVLPDEGELARLVVHRGAVDAADGGRGRSLTQNIRRKQSS